MKDFLFLAFLLVWFPLYVESTHAGSIKEEEQDDTVVAASNCKIVISTEHITGIKASQTIYTQAAKRSDCEKKAKPHRYNFYPKEIKEKSVGIVFEDKRKQR